MANEAIERTVDGLIQSGRISRDLREVYIRDMEAGLSDHLLRGSDYTKKTQELAEARRQFDAQVAQERQKLNERQQKLEGWYSNVQGDLQEYDRLKTTAAAYEQKLRDFNIYDEVEHPRQNIPTQRTPVDPRQNNIPDEKRPLTVEQANRFANDMLTLQSKMSRIQNEHFAVYGAPLPADEDLIAHFMKTGEDPEHYWRVKYNIEGKKQESIQRQRQEYEDKIRAEERAKVVKTVETYSEVATKLGITSEELAAAGAQIAPYVPDKLALRILNDASGPEITTFLAKNLVELDKVTRMDPMDAAVYLETVIKPAAKRPVPKLAPEPTDKLSGASVKEAGRGPKGVQYF